MARRRRGLDPLLPAEDVPLRALILGSFPSVESLRKHEYYGHPQNRFWRVLESCGVITSYAAPYRERVDELTAKGLAVWDLYAAVEREGSGDDAIHNARANNVASLWRRFGPFAVLLNGRRRGEWRRHFRALPVQPLPLPSTSPRPLHWNTPQSSAAAVAEWCAALKVLDP